jgi:acylphosphatase
MSGQPDLDRAAGDHPPTARLDAVVRGRVQGVGYRFFVISEASRFGLTGWVSNEPDGSVRCVAEGPRSHLEALLASLAEGPPGSKVEGVGTTWSAATGAFDGFTVKSGGHQGD